MLVLDVVSSPYFIVDCSSNYIDDYPPNAVVCCWLSLKVLLNASFLDLSIYEVVL